MSSHHDWVNQTVKLHNATKPFAPENGRCLRFAVGDKVIYTNPAGLKFRFSITGLPTLAAYMRRVRAIW